MPLAGHNQMIVKFVFEFFELVNLPQMIAFGKHELMNHNIRILHLVFLVFLSKSFQPTRC